MWYWMGTLELIHNYITSGFQAGSHSQDDEPTVPMNNVLHIHTHMPLQGLNPNL